jgi:hypothetical protein
LIVIIIIGVAVVLVALSVFSSRQRVSPLVVEAFWQTDDQQVSVTVSGTEVHGHVIVKATEEYVGSIVVKVRKDVSLWPDSDYQTATFPVNLAAGEQDLQLNFRPDEASNSRLRGYFLELNFKVTGATWVMENSYPPRLRVSG